MYPRRGFLNLCQSGQDGVGPERRKISAVIPVNGVEIDPPCVFGIARLNRRSPHHVSCPHVEQDIVVLLRNAFRERERRPVLGCGSGAGVADAILVEVVGMNPCELRVAGEQRVGRLIAPCQLRKALQGVNPLHLSTVLAGGVAKCVKQQAAFDCPLTAGGVVTQRIGIDGLSKSVGGLNEILAGR